MHPFSTPYSFTKNSTPSWVFFTFFKLYRCYQIAQCTYNLYIISNCKNSFHDKLKKIIEKAQNIL